MSITSIYLDTEIALSIIELFHLGSMGEKFSLN